MSQGKLNVTLSADRTARVTREFDAPPRLVWRAHTEPELVKKWLFGPDGWVLEHCMIDLRVGGTARYEMRRDRTYDVMGWTDTFREIAAPDRIVMTEIFDEDWTGGETLVTTHFREREGGRTLLDMTILFSSNEARDNALKTGMAEGMEMGYARVDALIAAGVLV